MALRADDVDLGRDSLLVKRFQAGDQAAFDDLYRRYFDRLSRFCQRRVGDPLEAEEIAQEAFARAFRAMPAFAGERRFYPWMTVIAGRLCVDAHRRRGRSTPMAEVDAGAVEADHGDVFAAVDRAHLTTAMEQLAPRHREVLHLRETQGWSYQRIAEHYDVSLGTVEALLHRARRALRREFEKVAGDQRAWAGLPVVGWLARRWAGLRSRACLRAAQVSEFATPLAAKVASVAMVVGSAAVIHGGGPALASAHAARPTARPAVVVSARQLVAAPAADPPAPTGPAAAGASVAPPGAAPAGGPPVAVGFGQAQTYNNTAPVHSSAAGTSLGADPSQVGRDAVAHVNNLLEKLP
jgi:RNA polymerase sigma-70 factor, ECF subfamily